MLGWGGPGGHLCQAATAGSAAGVTARTATRPDSAGTAAGPAGPAGPTAGPAARPWTTNPADHSRPGQRGPQRKPQL